ncbi:histidine kinase [Paenibacillus baekrokdamisoli]|uniref:Histidine kinase n=1 Tax=Paenibacillus baekrokdamisoli TaxID=1712516 RepID=A0A3G9IWW8_9BACL|nr:sensor histidine kinase [Paenibacillus baekrokdamisoli]MBB3067937.1 two-component system sensor histidine kinase YesM [Paenibacillus baekrokdamisoli]BBH23016.1 histidine kinase [Paenibacillus baekrokdamisoli]
MLAMIKNKVIDYYYSLSINKKITLFFMAALSLLIVLLAVFTYRISSSILIGKAIENTAQNLTLVSEKLEIIFDNAENYSKIAITNNTIQQITSEPSLNDPLQNYNKYVTMQDSLRNIVDAKTFVDAMIVYDRNHQIYDSGSLGAITDISDVYFNKFAHSFYGIAWEDTRISNYMKGNSRSDVISLFQKFNSAKTGVPLGLIQLSIDERYIANQYANIDLGESGDIFIVNKEGIIASDTHKDRLYTSISKDVYFPWALTHEGGKEFQVDGKKVLVVSRSYPRLDWIIIGIVPIHEITKDNQVLTDRFLRLGVIFVIAAIILTLLIAKSITKPLNKIKRTIQEVKGGNLDVWLDIKSRDEIGALAKEFNKMVGNTKILMENIIEEQKKKKEYELAVMQSQINPHFLYNTLESICGLADLKRNADVVKIVNQLALFYRGVLSKGSPVISMEDEIVITQTYLEILKIRYGDQIDYTLDFDPEVYKYKTIKLLLQPIVENSIYHGLKNKRGKGHIHIKGSVKGEYLVIVIADDGIGIQKEKLDTILNMDESDYKNKSFGVKSTDERIKLYFGTEYGLDIASEYGKGTVVTFTLPTHVTTRGDAE